MCDYLFTWIFMMCDYLFTWIFIDYYLFTWVVIKKGILMIINSYG